MHLFLHGGRILEANSPTHHPTPPAGQLSKVHCVFTDLEEEPEGIREEFTKLLLGLVCHRRDRQDQEEMRIVGNT